MTTKQMKKPCLISLQIWEDLGTGLISEDVYDLNKQSSRTEFVRVLRWSAPNGYTAVIVGLIED